MWDRTKNIDVVKQLASDDLNDGRAAIGDSDLDGVGVRDTDHLPVAHVSNYDRNIGASVSCCAVDLETSVKRARDNALAFEAVDGAVLRPDVFHEFPPIGWKVVGPDGEWEALPGDLLQHRSLPLDPARTWRFARSDHFNEDGTPILSKNLEKL